MCSPRPLWLRLSNQHVPKLLPSTFLMGSIQSAPVGMLVKVSVNLVEIEKRTLRFSVAVWDEKEVVGDGWHERAIIDTLRFRARVAKKREGKEDV